MHNISFSFLFIIPFRCSLIISRDSCDPQVGCQYVVSGCNNNNECLNDFSNCPQGGDCVTSDDCDDGDKCTLGIKNRKEEKEEGSNIDSDDCINDVCTHQKIECNDNNECTEDSCESLYGCIFRPISCGIHHYYILDCFYLFL